MKQAHAKIVHEALNESGINFVAYLPDDQIHDAQKLITEDAGIITVGATNESEAVSACAGAWLGAVVPVLLALLQRIRDLVVALHFIELALLFHQGGVGTERRTAAADDIA